MGQTQTKQMPSIAECYNYNYLSSLHLKAAVVEVLALRGVNVDKPRKFSTIQSLQQVSIVSDIDRAIAHFVGAITRITSLHGN